MATVEKQDTDLLTIEVDGREVQARKGEMLIEATDRAGIEIPRFCYHHKLSIAANCRMCLVDVEKAPKPLPACATPVAPGMKVFTHSKRARDAQRGVMEFLLINHPLDCPICDQGGECELQDLAMGYGRSISRFTERKRVVKDKNLGPLIATDMTRCIHCTRCVRFLEEVAGTAEMGGIGRGEKTEISTFIERNIESELSGNIIDLCPVGALTNKPFRFSARAWELSARPGVGLHDCVGSNLFYHVKAGRIMRCVPRENEAVNECWIADRDRYSHFGLQAEDRVTAPRIKVDGKWRETDWDTAMAHAAKRLRSVVDAHGAEQLGVLASPRATVEEQLLLARLAEELGTPHRDHRLRLADASDPALGQAWLDRPSAELETADAVLLVGSNLRHEQPILNQRVRKAWRRGAARVMDVNATAWSFPFDLHRRCVVAPDHWVAALGRVARAAFAARGDELPDTALGRYLATLDADETATVMAATLNEAAAGFLVLGDQALFHPQAAALRALATEIAALLDVALMVLPGPANSEGACRAGMVPGAGGLAASEQLRVGLKGYLLHDLEPQFDVADPGAARLALDAAECVIALASFAGSDLLDTADVILPLAPVPETDGSVINLDGTRQWLKAAAKPPGQAREGWKILRALGERLALDGFGFAGLADVVERFDALDRPVAQPAAVERFDSDAGGLRRAGPVANHAADSLLRRSQPLQQRESAQAADPRIHPETAARLGLADGAPVRLRQAEREAEAVLRHDSSVAPDTVVLASGTCLSGRLGAAWGAIEVEACP
ncbi:MAG: NADH-quinone oxidoreductase subunit NuoG [Wenzhouxiangellaceae bacterium]|nr:NADH-quinone oxidoreductase subunit NuoG [Wenzhouxiangellaceae bacterium]